MRATSVTAALFFAFQSPHFSFAQDVKIVGQRDALGLIEHAHVIVNDGVIGGCWTNSSTILNNAVLKLEQNGVETLDYDPEYYSPATPLIELSGSGFKAGIVCAGHFEVSVSYFHAIEIGDNQLDAPIYAFSEVLMFEQGYTLTNGSNLNSVKEFFDGSMSKLVTGIIKGRRTENVQEILSENLRSLAKPKPRKASE